MCCEIPEGPDQVGDDARLPYTRIAGNHPHKAKTDTIGHREDLRRTNRATQVDEDGNDDLYVGGSRSLDQLYFQNE